MFDIRKGMLEDAAAMAGIFNYYVRTSDVIFSNDEMSEEAMRNRLCAVVDGGYPFYVGVVDGEVAGYCFAHAWHPDPVYSRTWELTEYLRNDLICHGLGTALLSRVVEESESAGAHTLVACVTGGNEPCCRMLEKLNFSCAGRIAQAGYKFGRYLDDVFYQRIL